MANRHKDFNELVAQEFEDIGLTVYATIPVSDTQNKFADKIKA